MVINSSPTTFDNTLFSVNMLIYLNIWIKLITKYLTTLTGKSLEGNIFRAAALILDISLWHHHHPVNGRAHKTIPRIAWIARSHALKEHLSSVKKRRNCIKLTGRQTHRFFSLLKPVLAFNHGCVPLSVLLRGIRRHQLYSYRCFSGHFIRQFVFRVDECRRWGLHSLLALLFYSALFYSMHINQHQLYFPPRSLL